MLTALNQELFLTINAPAGLTGWAPHVAVFMAKDLVYSAWLILAGLWLWGGQARRQVVLLAFLCMVIGLVGSAIIGHLWFQPRPFALGLGHQYLAHSPDNSFPSDHATFLATLSFILLWFCNTRLAGIIMLIITLCVSWARIYVGIHFPMDMVGAYILSFICVLIILACQGPINRYLFSMLNTAYLKLFALPIRWGWVKG